MHKGVLIPVWFFVGLLLAIYGVLILASGIVEWSRPAKTVLAQVHAPVWWGALLAIIGVSYAIVFRPKRR
jgi:hypothetical protein